MDITEKKVNRQIQFWALVGPFVTLLTFAVLLAKGSASSFYLPVLILIGFPICWKWKIRGFAIAVGTLCLFFAISYSYIPIEERFWQFGMGMAIALAFAVTALSFEEVEELVHSLQVESSSRLTNLLHLDEKFKISEEKLHEEFEALKGQVQGYQSQIKEKDSQIQRQEKLIEVVRNEFSATQSQHEGLLNEIFQKRHEVGLLNERIQAYLKQIEQLTARSLSKISPEEMENLTDTIHSRDASLAQLHQELKKANQDLISIEAEKDRIQLELIKQKALLEEKENEYQDSSYQLRESLATLKREKSLLEMSLSRLQAEFEDNQAKELGYQGNISALTYNNLQFEQKLELQKKAFDELHALKANYEADFENLKSQLGDKEVAFNQLQKRLFQADEEINQLKAENVSLAELKNSQDIGFETLKKQAIEKSTFIEQLQNKIEEISQQVTHLEGENQALAELNVLKSEQEMHVEALKKLALEKTAIVEQLQGQLTQTDQKMALLQEENQILMSELKSLQGIDFGALQKQVLEKSTVVEELQSKLRMTDQEIAHLKSENQSLLDLGAQSRAQEAHLESLKKQAAENENALKQIREQLVLAEKTIVLLTEEKKTLTEQLGQAAVRADQESLAIPQEMLEADRSFRRMKGLYEQLKCQFADKSAVLDETRKQLFHLEEKFMQHQIDMQERETFGYSDIEKALEKQLIETQKNYAKMHRETVQEVEGLYEVIDNLLKQNV